MSEPAEPSTAASVVLNLSGAVQGGQQPISGATIQLYAANMTADFGASTPLLTTTVTTASDGTFTITGDYTCPPTNPPVYLVSTGGNPGLGGSVNNTDAVLMAPLGLCNTLFSSTVVTISEYSTAATTWLLGAFMQDATHIGASPTNPGAMAYWLSNAALFKNSPSGSTSATPLGLELNTFANILAPCVNSSGGTSGDGSACGKLLQYTGATDTATAALKITQTPSNNAANLYALITAAAPFQPYYSGVPSDFTSTAGYALPVNFNPLNFRAAALDSNGHLWIYTVGWTYNTATNVSTDVQGTLVVYDNNFNQLFTVPAGTGGLYYADSLAADASGHVFAVNANNTISEFGSSGNAISPAGGWSTGVSTVFTGTGSGNNYQGSSVQAGPIKIDSAGNIWGKVPGATGNCYFELNSSGTIITPASEPACTTLGQPINGAAGAPDGSGNAWAGGSSSIVKINSSGSVAATAPSATECFDSSTASLFYDRVGGQVWGYSELGAGVISDGGTLSFCNNSSATMPTISPSPFLTGLTVGQAVTLNGLTINYFVNQASNSAALDGAGNLWLITSGSFASGTATSSSRFNGTINYSNWLVEISPAGAILSPYNTSTGTYGYQPAGLGTNVSVNVSKQDATFTANWNPTLLGIDNGGNIWVYDPGTKRVLKIGGLATANTLNY